MFASLYLTVSNARLHCLDELATSVTFEDVNINDGRQFKYRIAVALIGSFIHLIPGFSSVFVLKGMFE